MYAIRSYYEGPLALVHFDAHCDTGDFYLGSRFHHGSPFKVAAEEGLIDPTKTIQIGIRGSVTDRDIWKFSYDSGMRVIHIEEFYQLGLDAVIAEIKRVVGASPVYVTFDVDGLDPVYAPGTGTVITSYSIHYTKLYDFMKNLHSPVQKVLLMNYLPTFLYLLFTLIK